MSCSFRQMFQPLLSPSDKGGTHWIVGPSQRPCGLHVIRYSSALRGNGGFNRSDLIRSGRIQLTR